MTPTTWERRLVNSRSIRVSLFNGENRFQFLVCICQTLFLNVLPNETKRPLLQPLTQCVIPQNIHTKLRYGRSFRPVARKIVHPGHSALESNFTIEFVVLTIANTALSIKYLTCKLSFLIGLQWRQQLLSGSLFPVKKLVIWRCIFEANRIEANRSDCHLQLLTIEFVSLGENH